jgi:hypothetical protein
MKTIDAIHDTAASMLFGAALAMIIAAATLYRSPSADPIGDMIKKIEQSEARHV